MQGMIRGQLNAAGIQWTEGDITLAVTSGGSDSSPQRPQRITSGDWSSLPFATPQAAYDALPKGISHQVLILQGSGSLPGFVAVGFVGGGRIRHIGTLQEAVITTGPTSGTAGAGTTSTSVVLPAEEDEWTPDELRGKFLVITGGAGASADPVQPVIRPILANFGSLIVVETIPDMDDTTEFAIQEPDARLTVADLAVPVLGTAVRAGYVACDVRIEAQQLVADADDAGTGFLSWRCQDVTWDGVAIEASSGTGLQAFDGSVVTVSNAVIEGAVQLYNIDYAKVVNGCQGGGGQIDAQGGRTADIDTDALGCSSTAVIMRHLQRGILKINANDGSAIPIDLYNINNFTTSAMDGANPSAPYYFVVGGGGHYVITGASGTGSGSNEFVIEGREGNYAGLSGAQAGTYTSRGTHLHWGSAGYTVYQSKLRVAAGGIGDDFEEFITNNAVIGGGVRYYGGQQFLDPAYKQIAAYAGGGQANATAIAFVNTVVTTVASAGDSVRMLDTNLDTSYAGGLAGTLLNAGVNGLDFYPPANLPSGGRQLIVSGVALGADQPYRLPPGHRLFWQVRNDLDIDCHPLGTADVQDVISGTTYTMRAADVGRTLIFTAGTTVTITVPAALPAGWWCNWERAGAGQLDFAGSAVTPANLRNWQSHTKSGAQWSSGQLRCHVAGDVTLSGATGV